jgi:protein-S-isoprenylcysteine O-methyltransferase Ste14
MMRTVQPFPSTTPFVVPAHASPPRPSSAEGDRGARTPAAHRRRRIDLPDLVARALIVGLFLGLAFRIGQDALITGRPTGLLLLASELLVVVLTLVRRKTDTVDRRWRTRLIAGASIVGPFLLRPSDGMGLSLEMMTATVSAAGLAIVVIAKLSLGRSFGLLPANRGVVSSGLYRLVRHPIYLGYLFTHGAFLAANPSWWNVAALATADVALLVRSAYEEEILRQDPAYVRYTRHVRWRIVPGLF